MKTPALETQRLLLRPFRTADIPAIVHFLSDPVIAETTLNVPYPYDEEKARSWLASQQQERDAGTGYTFAIVRKKDAQVMGAIDIRPLARHKKAEIGYWIGKPHWGQSYATEAARAIIRYGFETLGLNRIYATHFIENPASGRVMQKAGMTYEGTLRQDVLKGEHFRDHVVYGILREAWKESEACACSLLYHESFF